MKYKKILGLTVCICLVSILFWMACGKQENLAENNNGTDKENIVAFGLNTDKNRLSSKLHFFNFPDYMDPQLLKTFEKYYGVEVITDYYDNNETLIAKLQAGGTGQYDLVVISDFAVSILQKKGLLEELDKGNIPNIQNLGKRFQELPFDVGNRYSICYQWGTQGFGIRTDLIDMKSKKIDTWKVLFDPDYQLGPFTVLNDPRETIATALLYLGYSVNSRNEMELKAVESLLIAQKKRVLAYASSSHARDLLVSGDAVVVHNYSGDIYLAKNEVPTVDYIIPEEGTILWTDNLAIPLKAPHKYTAEVFINFLLDAQNGASLTNFTQYASPNRASLPHIQAEIRDNPKIFPPDTILEKCHSLEDVGEAMKLYDEVWTRVKASGN